jgi:hypothetical protein
MELERRSSKPDVASSSLAEAISILDLQFLFWIEIEFQIISGSSNGRTADFESVNRGSNPLPEAKQFYKGVPQMDIWACLGNMCS